MVGDRGEGRDKGNRVVVTLPVGPCPPPLFDPAAPYPRLAFPFVGSCRGSPSLPLSFSYLFNNERKGRRLTEPHGVGYNRMTVKRERNERERARPCQPSFVFFSSLYSLATPTIPLNGRPPLRRILLAEFYCCRNPSVSRSYLSTRGMEGWG